MPEKLNIRKRGAEPEFFDLHKDVFMRFMNLQVVLLSKLLGVYRKIQYEMISIFTIERMVSMI